MYGFVVFRSGSLIDWRTDGQDLPKSSQVLYAQDREGNMCTLHGYTEESPEGQAITKVIAEAIAELCEFGF